MRFDDRVTGNLKTYALNAKKIHVEIDAAEINKNVKVDVGLVGDVGEVLRALLPRVEPRRPRRLAAPTSTRCKGDSAVRDIQNLPDSGHLYAAHVIHDLWRETGGNAVVVTDVGQHQMWEAQYYHHDDAAHAHHRRAGSAPWASRCRRPSAPSSPAPTPRCGWWSATAASR